MDAGGAALRLPWSTEPVEDKINKLKLIKRSMYGRANKLRKSPLLGSIEPVMTFCTPKTRQRLCRHELIDPLAGRVEQVGVDCH
jgi:hypothetical protein